MLTKREKVEKATKRISLWLSGSKREARPAFIFGEMRSGTNMLARALNRCRDAECYYENDNEVFDEYVLRQEEVIRRAIARSRAKVVIFKSIADSQTASKLLDRYEGSRAVWIYRRYTDAVNSALKNWKEHNKYLYYVLHDPGTARWRAENISDENRTLVEHYYNKGISDASARSLIWYLRNVLYFEQSLDERDNVLLVNYETVVQNPAQEFSRITSFLGCRFSDRVTAGVFRSSVNKDRFPEIDSEIKELCDGLFQRLEEAHRR